MLESIGNWLFDPSGVTPHGFCLLWEPGLIWLHAVSDSAIALAYFTIPLALAIVARRRRDLVFRPLFICFAAFILLCGTGHWLDLLTLWIPLYWVQGVIKAATALASVATAIALWWLLPQALALPSPAQLRAAYTALSESESRHRLRFEHSPVPLQTLDGDGVITGISDSWLDWLGYPAAQVIGKPISHFWAPQTAAADLIAGQRLLTEGDVHELEQHFLTNSGAVRVALVSSRFERHDGGAWIMCVLIDISARREAEAALRASEERLHQAQKMEAVGQLTGGIAHDFNNMLQGISGCLELMERRIGQGRLDDAVHYIHAARQSVDRAAGLTHRMLAFARRQALEPQPVAVGSLVGDMAELIRHTVGPGVNVRLVLGHPTWPALCDPNQLESALLNLAINGRDAMGEAGTLSIATSDRVLTQADLTEQDEASPGEYVEISVSDTGSGMTPQVVARVFEPFFTTKPPGQGTGLGLSQLYGFVRQSGGLVRIASTPGQGTTVRIFLPRHQGAHSGKLQPEEQS
jgi:PAS domain S-box-containing protein